MNIDELNTFCNDVRTVLEEKYQSMWLVSLRKFPNGSCGDTSRILSRLLYKRLGLESEVVSGFYHNYEHTNYPCGIEDRASHAWVELEDYIIDLTSDQFNKPECEHPPVFISKDKSFHCFFAHSMSYEKSFVKDCEAMSQEMKADLSSVNYELIKRGW